MLQKTFCFFQFWQFIEFVEFIVIQNFFWECLYFCYYKVDMFNNLKLYISEIFSYFLFTYTWNIKIMQSTMQTPQTLWYRIQPMRGVLDTTLCDKVCQWLANCRWFSPGTSISSTNKIDRHDINETLLKVGLSTIKPNQKKTKKTKKPTISSDHDKF